MSSDPWIGRTLAGCRLLERLGEGAMATVYKAHHSWLDMPVAVKILKPAIAKNERLVQFFLREARSAARLHHTNIARIYHCAHEHDAYFIVMQLVEGRNLRDLVGEVGPLDLRRATRFTIDVLLGLAEAHRERIVHRDIKPSNLLVTPEGRAMIVDFGLARPFKDGEGKKLTLSGEVIGTAYYIAPEQALGKPIDGRADLYSVGATYYYLLSARHPFEGSTAVEVIHKQINEPLVSVARVMTTVPESVSRIIDRLMSKRPEDRYATAKDVLEDLYAVRSATPGRSPASSAGGLVFTSFSEELRALEGSSGSPKAGGAEKAPERAEDMERVPLAAPLTPSSPAPEEPSRPLAAPASERPADISGPPSRLEAFVERGSAAPHVPFSTGSPVLPRRSRALTVRGPGAAAGFSLLGLAGLALVGAYAAGSGALPGILIALGGALIIGALWQFLREDSPATKSPRSPSRPGA